MGIRFLCYHCEKRLNVKENQAGQKGKCPHCDGVVTIPSKSTILSEEQKKERQEEFAKHSAAIQADRNIGLHNVDDQVTLDGIPAERRGDQGLAIKAEPTATSKPAVAESSSTEMFLLTKPELPASLGKVDPIAQSPTSVWYFRSRELGEKGPLKGKVMQEHLDRGDVKIGCVVWREDWEDWVPAEKVFPKLVAEFQAQQGRKPHPAFKDANYQISDTMASRTKRLRKQDWIFRSLICLGFVIICILTIILIQLVSQ